MMNVTRLRYCLRHAGQLPRCALPGLAQQLRYLSTTPSREIGSGRIEDKVAVITGAGGGIGRETAILFAREGARGIICADLDQSAAEETAKMANAEVRKEAKIAVPIKVDVAKEDDCKRMIDLAVSEFRDLHILFNNAGIMHPEDGNMESTSDSIWDLTLAVNLKGVVYGCRHALPHLRRCAPSSVINTASFVAIVGAATPQVAYTASKGAVLSLSRELAVLHAREGVRVNALCPGPLNTPLLQSFLDTPEKRARRLVHLPTGRFGEAVEMARAALFLASNESSYITGAQFSVDGGLTAAYVTDDKKVDPFGGPMTKA